MFKVLYHAVGEKQMMHRDIFQVQAGKHQNCANYRLFLRHTGERTNPKQTTASAQPIIWPHLSLCAQRHVHARAHRHTRSHTQPVKHLVREDVTSRLGVTQSVWGQPWAPRLSAMWLVASAICLSPPAPPPSPLICCCLLCWRHVVPFILAMDAHRPRISTKDTAGGGAGGV